MNTPDPHGEKYNTPNLRKSQHLRNKEYYQMTELQDELYTRSKAGNVFTDLMQYIVSEDNILLAYRSIKSNKGSLTAGVDNKTIRHIEKLDSDVFVRNIQNTLSNYSPLPVRRVEIPKPGTDKTRPLGIPCIKDRIIQQAIKQVMEPVCEAKFHRHSYGFRPARSTTQAKARFESLINQTKLHYAVDIDIKSFFDNVSHSKLLRQLWTMGIRDKNLLSIISKMLKAEIEGIGKPTKGTPQGGILSPLLSNIVLNELDWWISSQWESFPLRHKWISNKNRYTELKKTNLKECFIVRYADDFKILCRHHKDAKRVLMAVQLWLKDRLQLEISKEKSKITNLRNEYSDFLGYRIKAMKKGKTVRNGRKEDKFVAQSRIATKAFQNIVRTLKEKFKQLAKGKIHVGDLNAYILGIHGYFAYASQCSLDFSKIHSLTRKSLNNRLKPKRIKDPSKVPKYIKDTRYSESKQLRTVQGEVLLPTAYIKCKTPLCSSQLSPYVKEDREKLHKELKAIPSELLQRLLKGDNTRESVLLRDNKLSRLCAAYGRCEVTQAELTPGNMEIHHRLPRKSGGGDEYSNLIWVLTPVHKLIHATDENTTRKYLDVLNLDPKALKKVNELRKQAGNEAVKQG